MKLEVGMYVRTKDGVITKIEQIVDDEIHFNIKSIFSDGECLGYNWFYIKDVVKASNNIIDLIEEGDYVNGCYVTNRRSELRNIGNGHHKQIGIIKCNAYFNQGNYNDCEFKWIDEEEIKSIVTKEQFESIKYSLEG